MSASSRPSCWKTSAMSSAASPTPTRRSAILGENEFAVDLVFSGVIMPGMNGVELAGIIRERYPGLPVVLTSGYSNVLAENAHRGFELIQKPYSVESLSRILRKAITGEAVGGAVSSAAPTPLSSRRRPGPIPRDLSCGTHNVVLRQTPFRGYGSRPSPGRRRVLGSSQPHHDDFTARASGSP